MAKPDLDPLAGEGGGEESRRLAVFWRTQINEVGDSPTYKRWYKRGEQVEARYRDERNRAQEEGEYRRYNALWANIQILLPALYGKCPIPVAERRFKDKDPIGRGAATILERGLRNEIEICGFHESMACAVQDYLLPGRGVVWVRYEPIVEEGPSLTPTPETDIEDEKGDIKTGKSYKEEEEEGENGGSDKVYTKEVEDEETESPEEEAAEGESDEAEEKVRDQQLESTGSRVLRESTPVDYLPWKDFYALPARARTWAEVTAVAKKVYMSRDQLKRRFGAAIGKAVPFERDQRGKNPTQQMGGDDDEKKQDKAAIYEIWSRQDSQVYWIAEGYDYLCDKKDDPLKLDEFFPVPRPLFANATSTTLVPVPDYYQYQDQARQIDELTQRISMLTKACKVAGVYNAAAKDVQRLFDEAVDNQLIPVDDWAAFAEKNGVEGNISFIPLKEIMGVLNELIQVKQLQIEEMDRLTGINDIMRGTSDARETLGGVRLKANNTGTRLTHRQDEVARFARDTVRIMADIMCKHFSPQSLIDVSGALYAEGLGPNDMPPLTALQSPTGSLPGVGGATPPQQGGQAPTQQGAAGTPPPQPTPQPQQTGGAVVPYQPPGLPAAMPNMGTPQIPPDVQRKLEAVERIIQAIGLLRDERLLGFRVDIEVDSTIYGDSEQEKKDRIEFIKATTDYLQQAMLMGQQMPEMVPLLGKFLQFGVRGFKIGRDLETFIEETVDELPELIKNRIAMGQQMPNPDMLRAQAEMMKAQATVGDQQAKRQAEILKANASIAQAQQQMQVEQQKSQAEIARQAIENEGERTNAQLEQQKQQEELRQTQIQTQSDLEIQRMDKEIKLIELKIKMMEMQGQQRAAQQQAVTEQAKMQATASQVHVEKAKSEQVAHQVPIEQERTKQAGINAEAAKFKAAHPPPAKPSSSEGGGE